MEILIASAAAVVVGLATGQYVTIGLKGSKQDSEWTRRVQAIEKVIPDLIPRAEVQDAINKVPPLVAQQVQSELTAMAAQLTAQIPVQQPPAPVQMPPMPSALFRRALSNHRCLSHQMRQASQQLLFARQSSWRPKHHRTFFDGQSRFTEIT